MNELLFWFKELPTNRETIGIVSQILTLVTLTREFDGAARFIHWAFSTPPPDIDRHFTRPGYGSISLDNPDVTRYALGVPDDARFQTWLHSDRESGEIKAPQITLVELIDIADEFVLLWDTIKENVHIRETGQDRELVKSIHAALCFNQTSELHRLATDVRTQAEKQLQETPVELLARALQEFGIQGGTDIPDKVFSTISHTFYDRNE